MHIPLRTGNSLHVHDHPEYISHCIRDCNEYFERRLLDTIRSQFDLTAVIDIGANIGNHSHFFVHECGSRCYSFEPSAVNYSLLKANCPNQYLYNIALSNQPSISQLFTYRSSMGNSTLSELWDTPPPWGDGLVAEQIVVMPLDSFSFPEVTFIKIDVEGAELRVLQGASQTIRRHLPALCIEYGGDEGLADAGIEYTSSDIWDFLKPLSYVFVGNDGGPNNFFLPRKALFL